VRGIWRIAVLLVAVLALAPIAFAGEPSLQVEMLPAGSPQPGVAAVAAGRHDREFVTFSYGEARRRGEPFWLRLEVAAGSGSSEPTALVIRKGRHLEVEVYAAGSGGGGSLPMATEQPGFRGVHDRVLLLPAGLAPGEALYARVSVKGSGSEELIFTLERLERVLERGARQARVVTLAFGALAAMSLAALLIWSVLPGKLLLLYATLFAMQALYVAYFSGQGFDWPLLDLAQPLNAHAWNVPAAWSGAAACLFVREIADLRRFLPRAYAAFGGLAVVFILLSFANVADLLGFGGLVARVGNVAFLGAAVFTLVVAFLAWRRGSRAAGWFLLAWGLLEAFTIATAASFLFSDAEPPLLYYGLPLSMVAAAILIALGVADRLREQRAALGEAQRRAQIDPLTGVLNRRSLLEHLDAACDRAQARGLPVALLFIDLDHFKEINDSRGHLAGDACLRAVIGPIQSELRQSDVIGRYGGEEFVVILSSANETAAQAIAERILRRVADLRVEGHGAPITLTCSIGVAASDALGVWGERLIARADEAVYAAKHSGRNRVRLALPAVA
jgi:two-component system, sensor histidine kinase LadS